MTKNWVKLQIEPVEVSCDSEESLLFSTVQSVVPGAHGLYYRENGQRKALGFETNTGRVFAPPAGWEAQNIYIHLAHGSRHGTHYADYSKASAQFEKNVSAVQKLIAAAGLSYGLPRASKHGRSRSKVKSGFEAQPENVHISDESEDHSQTISQSIDTKKSTIVEETEELKLQLKDTKRQLRDTLKELGDLKAQREEEKKQQKTLEPKIQIEEVESTKTTSDDKLALLQEIQNEQTELIRGKDDHIHSLCVQLEEAKSRIQELSEKDDEVNNLHNVIEDLRGKLITIEKEKLQVTSELAEQIDLLQKTKDKVTLLENAMNNQLGASTEIRVGGSRPRSRNTSESFDETSFKGQIRALETKLQMSNSALRTTEADKQKLQESNWYANERLAKVEKENAFLKGSSEEMRNRLNTDATAHILGEKDQMISELAEQRAKLEWRIGELSQWWNDSKWKIGELESGIAHQRYLLESASTKIQSLNDQLNIALRAPATPSSSFQPTSAYTLNQNAGQWQISGAGFPSIAPMSYPSFPAPPQSYFGGFAPQMAQVAQLMPQTYTRKVQLEVDNAENKEVFVLGSFLNWQCALKCETTREGKSGISIDLPRGRHEFRFLHGGEWKTSSSYAAVPNGFLGSNNIICVE